MTHAQGRPRLLLFVAPFSFRQKSAVAVTLAWLAEAYDHSFELYYDDYHAGTHYGGGDPRHAGRGTLSGGLVSGARHVEALQEALLRFQTTAICCGDVAFAAVLDNADAAGGTVNISLPTTDIAALYRSVFDSFQTACPGQAVMLDRSPSPALEGIDAYCYPEVFYRKALGIEASISQAELQALHDMGVREILACGVAGPRTEELEALGFAVKNLDIIRPDDDYATVTHRLSCAWKKQRGGFLLGDPVLAAHWLPAACRERRSMVYSVPQSRVIGLLQDDLKLNRAPILGRQFEDGDFFTLSSLGQSFQLVDPCRPPLPVLGTHPARFPAHAPNPTAGDPTDEQLREYARQGRVLTSLVFWTGMLRETENLYLIADLLAITGLRAGLAWTVQSIACRPPALDLMMVPVDQGGLYPHVELLLASCGTGAAIESLLTADQLAAHLGQARAALDSLGLPEGWQPTGWWPTLDVRLVRRGGRDTVKSVQVLNRPPFLRFRYARSTTRHAPAEPRRGNDSNDENAGAMRAQLRLDARAIARRARGAIRKSRLGNLFEAYRPYEHYMPGDVNPTLMAVARQAGLTYALTKAGFGKAPHCVFRDREFVALNYTAGHWDGWTPFETVDHEADIRSAERRLLAGQKPGWLLGSIDSCLWMFSGEVWRHAPRMLALAQFVAQGGASGKLVNVRPAVIARYARILSQ